MSLLALVYLTNNPHPKERVNRECKILFLKILKKKLASAKCSTNLKPVKLNEEINRVKP
jgi:hypothetical protein